MNIYFSLQQMVIFTSSTKFKIEAARMSALTEAVLMLDWDKHRRWHAWWLVGIRRLVTRVSPKIFLEI